MIEVEHDADFTVDAPKYHGDLQCDVLAAIHKLEPFVMHTPAAVCARLG